LADIYGDAKKLTLSARTFPARITISHLASQFSYLDPKPQCEADLDCQYISPAAHKEFLQCIVESDRKSFAQKIMDDTLAISLRCDRTVDRTHTDKVYVMVKVIMKSCDCMQLRMPALKQLEYVQQITFLLMHLPL